MRPVSLRLMRHRPQADLAAPPPPRRRAPARAALALALAALAAVAAVAGLLVARRAAPAAAPAHPAAEAHHAPAVRPARPAAPAAPAPEVAPLCAPPRGAAATIDGEPIPLAELCGWLARVGAVRGRDTDLRQARTLLAHLIDAALVARALAAARLTVGGAEVEAAARALPAPRHPAGAAPPDLLARQLRAQLELRRLVAARGPGALAALRSQARIEVSGPLR